MDVEPLRHQAVESANTAGTGDLLLHSLQLRPHLHEVHRGRILVGSQRNFTTCTIKFIINLLFILHCDLLFGDNLERPDKENTTEMWNGKRKSPVPMQTKNPQPWEWGPILEITLCSIISTHSSCFGFLSAYCAVNSTVPSLKTWIQTWKLLTFDQLELQKSHF